MPRPLRLLTGLAVAQLAATALVAISRNVHQPLVVVAIQADHAEIGVPVVLFAAIVIFLCIAWSYLLTGVLHARWPLRVAGLAVISLAMIALLTDGYQYGDRHVGIIILGGYWILGLVVTLQERRRPPAEAANQPTRSDLRGYTFVAALILTSAFYGEAWLSSGSWDGLGGAIYKQFTRLTYYLVPLLYLAGSDFAEWGELVGARLASSARRRGLWPPLTLCVVVALAIVGYTVVSYGWSFVGIQLVFGAVCALLVAGLVWIARVGPGGHAHVPVRALVIGTVITLAWNQGGYAILRNLQSVSDVHDSPLGTLIVYSHEDDPVFSIQVPPKWKHSDWDLADGSRDLRFSEGKLAPTPQFNVVAGSAATAAPGDDLPVAVASLGYDKVMPTKGVDGGGWRNWAFTAVNSNGDAVNGKVFQRANGDRVWTIVGDSPPDKVGDVLGAYDQMVMTWRPSLPADSRLYTAIHSATYDFSWVPWVVVVIGVALALGRRRHRGTYGVTGAVLLFLGISGIFRIIDGAPSGLTAAFGHGQGAGEGFRQGLSIEGILLTMAVVSLAVAAWAAFRRTEGTRFAVLSMLAANVGLALLAGVLNLYDAAIAAEGRFSLALAAIILLAILWDLVMSGQSITNKDGQWFPRHTRVLIYCGYTLLVAAAILFYSSQHLVATGVAAAPDFESDVWPQLGVAGLGVPLLVTLLVVSLARLLRHRPAGETPATDPVDRLDPGPARP